MGRLLPALMWAGVIMLGFAAYVVSSAGPLATLGFAIPCLLCIAGLFWHRSRQAAARRSLPHELAELWYRSGVASVAFRWCWRGKTGTRVRILRSETRSARSANRAEGPDRSQTSVYDGTGTHALDAALTSRTTYHYTVWVEESRGRWHDPMRLLITPMAADEARHLEASYRGSSRTRPGRPSGADRRDALGTTLVPDPIADPHGVDVERARNLGDMGGLSIAGSAVGGVLTDAVFAVADGLVGDRLADEGWQQVE